MRTSVEKFPIFRDQSRICNLLRCNLELAHWHALFLFETTLDVNFSTPYQNIVIFSRELFSNKCKCVMYKASAIHHSAIRVYVVCRMLANTKADRNDY